MKEQQHRSSSIDMPFDKTYHQEKLPLTTEDQDEEDLAREAAPPGGKPAYRSLTEKTVPLWAFAASSCAALILALSLVVLLLFAHHRTLCPVPRRHPDYDFSGYQCAPLGAPPEVARARGCEFDTFTLHWYSMERFQNNETLELMREFTDMDWPRFYDEEARHRMAAFDPSQSQAWVSKKEHLWHCGYLLIQTHLWIVKGFDPPVSYEHTVHCARTLLDTIEKNPPADLLDIKANVKTPPDPANWPLVKPHYPCAEEGLFCISE